MRNVHLIPWRTITQWTRTGISMGNLFSVSMILNLCKIWIVQYLDCTRFGSWEIWILQYLDLAIFGWCMIWFVQDLDHAWFGSCKIWILQDLDCWIVQDLDHWIVKNLEQNLEIMQDLEIVYSHFWFTVHCKRSWALTELRESVTSQS